MKVTKFLVRNCHEMFTAQSVNTLIKMLTPNERKLFDALSADEVKSDREIQRMIYGDVASNNRSFPRMKAKLHNKLMDMKLVNVAGSSIQCAKKRLAKKRLFVESIQIMNTDRETLVIAAKECKEEALAIGVYDVAADMCRRLSLHYMQYARCTTKAQKYRALHDQYTITYNEEKAAEWKFAQAVNMANALTNIDNDAADAIYKMHSTIKLDFDSNRLHFFWYCLRAMEAHLRGDTDLKVQICKDAIAYFQDLYFRHSLTISVLRRMLISTYISMGKLALAETIIHVEILEEDKTKEQRLNLKMELAQIRIKMGAYYKALETLKGIDLKQASNQTQKERIMIDILYLEILTLNKNVNFQATNRKCRTSKIDINGGGLQLLVAECVCHYLNGHAWKVEDKASKLKARIRALDQEKQAHWINFLYEMMGCDIRLDESKADRGSGRWMVGVDDLRSLIANKLKLQTA